MSKNESKAQDEELDQCIIPGGGATDEAAVSVELGGTGLMFVPTPAVLGDPVLFKRVLRQFVSELDALASELAQDERERAFIVSLAEVLKRWELPPPEKAEAPAQEG